VFRTKLVAFIKANMGICKLCGVNAKLIASHIIPKSFWGLDRRGVEPLAILNNKSDRRPQPSRQGLYDSSILCEACDNKLGLFDQHAIEQLVRVAGTPLVHDGDELGVLEYPGADPNIIHDFITEVGPVFGTRGLVG
jgi:hypothetical protein